MATSELTAKQEAFAVHFVMTGNAAESYRAAYDVAENARDGWIYVEALQMLEHPKVAPRIDELRAAATKAAGYGILDALDEYEKARKMAEDEKNPSASVAAVTGKVRLFGLDKPRKFDIESPNGTMTPQAGVNLSNLSEEDLDALERLTDKARDTAGKGEAE